MFRSSGLTQITHSMSNPVKITPFLPGHFEVFDLKQNGKVESIQLDRFHRCTEEPKHAAYDNAENLGTGKNVQVGSTKLNWFCGSSTMQNILWGEKKNI